MTEAPPVPPPAPAGGKTNGLAIASLVMGIVGFLGLGVCVGGVVGIPAVICGHIALGQIKKSGQGGRGLAIVGLVLGYVVIAFLIIGLVLGGAAFLIGTSASEEMLQEMERMQESMPPPEDMGDPGR